MQPILLLAATDTSTLFAGLSAVSLILTAITTWLVYRAAQKGHAKKEQSDLVRAEHDGWTKLLTNLRHEYESTYEELVRAQEALQRANVEIASLRRRIAHLERLVEGSVDK